VWPKWKAAGIHPNWSTLGPPAQLQKGRGCSAVKANQFRIFHRLLTPCFCPCVDHVGIMYSSYRHCPVVCHVVVSCMALNPGVWSSIINDRCHHMGIHYSGFTAKMVRNNPTPHSCNVQLAISITPPILRSSGAMTLATGKPKPKY